MQYCYNFEDINDFRQNLYGVCVELSIPYIEGQIVTKNGRQYRVYKAAQNFFQSPDRSWFLGHPTQGFPSNPSEVISYIFNHLEYNFGGNLITTPIQKDRTFSDWVNFRADFEGFEFYPAAWNLDISLIQASTIFINCLNELFDTYMLPMRAVMWGSTDGVIAQEKFCILSRETDSFKIELEKDVFLMNLPYAFEIDVNNQLISIDLGGVYTQEPFIDALYNSYAWRSLDNCPCNRGVYCYSMIHCKDSDLDFNFCSTSYIPYGGKVVFLQSSPNEFYTLQYNGENTCLCEQFLDAAEIGLSIYETCDNAYDVDNILVKNCQTNELKQVTIEAGIIDRLCEKCPIDYIYNPITNTCDKIEVVAPTPNSTLLSIAKGGVNTTYTRYGAYYYPDITLMPLPIKNVDSPYNIVDNINTIIPPILAQTGIWRNTNGSNGRLNTVGIIANPMRVNEWYGFSYCLSLNEAKTLMFGFSMRGQIRITINGILVVNMDGPSRSIWHLMPYLFNQGINLITVEFKVSTILPGESFGFEIYNATHSELSSITTLAALDSVILFSTLGMVGGVFSIGETTGLSCASGYTLNNCDPLNVFCEKTIQIPPSSCNDQTLRTEEYPCDCFEIVEINDTRGEYVNVTHTYLDCQECLTTVQNCAISETTTAISYRIRLPNILEPDRNFKECGFCNIVFADMVDNVGYKNDFYAVYFQKQTNIDNCMFELISGSNTYALDTNLYGQFWDFGDVLGNPNLTAYRVDWKNVLRTLGEGTYSIKKTISVAGISYIEFSNTFTLTKYSENTANGTVRFDAYFKGKFVHLGVDFKELNIGSSIRVKGFFGNRTPTYEQDNIVCGNYRSEQIKMSQNNEYNLELAILPECITEQLFDFFIFANDLYINDYNAANHSYKYLNYPIEYSGIKEIDYPIISRGAKISLTFADRIKNKVKLNC